MGKSQVAKRQMRLTVTARIPSDLYDRAHEAAKKRRWSVSEFTRWALEQAVERDANHEKEMSK